MRRWLLVLLLAVPLESRGAVVVSGEVRDQAGTPVTGAWVTARDVEQAREVTVYTADDGRFRTPSLGAGRVQLRARAYGFQDRSVTLELGAQDLARTVTLTNSYGGTPKQIALRTGKTTYTVTTTNRWYDVSVTTTADTTYLRRFAGHVETGAAGVSDPAIRTV